MTFDKLVTDVLVYEDSLGAGAPIYSGSNISQKPSSVSGFKGDSIGGADEVLVTKENHHFINICPRCHDIEQCRCRCPSKNKVKTNNLCFNCKQLEQNIK